MILADTTIWIDHLRHGDPVMTERLNAGAIVTHRFVIGEIALGSLRERDKVLTALRDLPAANQASDAEVQAFIEAERLYGIGVGYIDVHLLAAVRITPGVRLWTRDRQLNDAAVQLGVAEPAWAN